MNLKTHKKTVINSCVSAACVAGPSWRFAQSGSEHGAGGVLEKFFYRTLLTRFAGMVAGNDPREVAFLS